MLLFLLYALSLNLYNMFFAKGTFIHFVLILSNREKNDYIICEFIEHEPFLHSNTQICLTLWSRYWKQYILTFLCLKQSGIGSARWEHRKWPDEYKRGLSCNSRL